MTQIDLIRHNPGASAGSLEKENLSGRLLGSSCGRPSLPPHGDSLSENKAKIEPSDTQRLGSDDLARSPGSSAVGFLNPKLFKFCDLIILLP